tara:strand:+ start:5397 stop:7244 length:1848 start_codon:yes stop_codon:yes gene_type:complete
MNQVVARTQVSYEVYAKDRSGRWEIHAHFTGAQKKQAEEEARSLERMTHVSAAKVIREVYNHNSNAAEEYVVYETRQSGPKEPAQVAPARSGPAGSAVAGPTTTSPSESYANPHNKPATAKPKQTAKPTSRDQIPGLISLVLKLMIAFCIAIAIGLLAMLGAAQGLGYLPDLGMSISQGAYDKVNFMAFIVGFLASAVPMLMNVTQKFQGRSQSRTRAIQKTSPTTKRPNPGRRIKANQRPTAAFADINTRPDHLEETGKETASDTVKNATEDTTEDTSEDTAEDVTSTTEVPDGQEQNKDGVFDKPLIETPAMQTTRKVMKSFIAGSMEAIKRTVQNMDAYHKFGVNLYVAGACDACSEKNALPTGYGRGILKDCITALGATGNMADTFCKSVDNYILEPKYKDMYGAGRSSMDAYIEDERSITTSVSRAIAAWIEKPGNAQVPDGGKKLHALMFTDIVNSTQMTQKLGDVGAQQMVHIHNQIVRTALINNYGKEVKHMGDGIMAVFPSSASSVEAAIEIQRNMASHNERGELKFQIRIGINTGEAIAEENDLFGTVVQLAARVCSQADGDEILISKNVKDTYAGSRAIFTTKGTRQMKGFAEPIEVFSVTARA